MLKSLISLNLSTSLKLENEKQKEKLTFSRLEDQKIPYVSLKSDPFYSRFRHDGSNSVLTSARRTAAGRQNGKRHLEVKFTSGRRRRRRKLHFLSSLKYKERRDA